MALDIKTSDLSIELENIIEREPKLSKNGNWGSEMVGEAANIIYILLCLMTDLKVHKLYLSKSMKTEDILS